MSAALIKRWGQARQLPLPPSLPPRLVFETSAAERKKPVDAAASTTTTPPAEAKAAKRGLPVPLGVDGVDIAFLLFFVF